MVLFLSGRLRQVLLYGLLKLITSASSKAQMSLLISAVLTEPLLLAVTKYESRGRLRPKPGLLAPLDGCECFKSDFMRII